MPHQATVANAGVGPSTGPRILVLHQHYWPEIAATAQILTDLCEDLSAAGCHVSVICGQPSYRSLESTLPIPAYETRRGVHIQRVWSYVPPKRSIPQRLAHYGSYFCSSLARALTHEPFDLCLVMSTPPLLLGLSGMILHALRATPFVYCVQDLYPDIAVHLGVLRANGAAARLTGTAANACYRAAHTLVALSEGMADQLIAKGVPADRIHVIPNWADTSDVSPQPRDNPLARTLGCDTGFVIQYSGNLGLSQGLESVLEAAEMVQDLPIRFMLVGDGNARAALQASASSKQLTNVSFYPAQPRERLPDLLSACDIGLVTMKRGVGNDLVPSKLYGIMAAGRPVLAAVEATSEVARVVRVHECGWTAEPESPRELASTIRIAFASSKNERQKIGERGRQTCVANYSRKSSTARYGKLITAIVDQAPREAAGANPKASNTPWAEL